MRLIAFMDFHILDHYIELFNDHHNLPFITAKVIDKKLAFIYRFYDGKQYELIRHDKESFCKRFTKALLIMTDEEIIKANVTYDIEIERDPSRFYEEIIITLSMSILPWPT